MIPYTKYVGQCLRNLDALPRGTGAPYLLAIRGEGTDLIAKAWKRKLPTHKSSSEVIIFFGELP